MKHLLRSPLCKRRVRIKMAIGRENSARFLRVLIIISISSFSSSLTHTEPDVQDQPNLLPCNHDEIAEKNPYRVNLASQGGKTRDKRQLTYSNIRIHPVLTYISYSADEFVQGNDSLLSKAIDTLQSILSVHPVQGNLTLPPMCTEYTEGLNEGKCMAPLPSQDYYQCGDYGVIPPEYIGTREVCNSSNGSCTIQGPDGPGLPNADYLLFVSASESTFSCYYALAYASYCALDISDKNRPVVGYIHICTSFLEDFREQPDIIYGVFMHEIIHALGFSSRLFDKFVDTNGNNYNPAVPVTGPHGSTYAFTGPKTMEFAKQYYDCDDIQGVYLENEGGSGTASSHWERRTLQHEVMNGYISRDYCILSEFTIALFEDSGWYKANYTALYNLKQNPLQWGKGLGCPFLTEPCTNHSAFPYLCDTSETELLCTYDHLSKGNCSTLWPGFDGCPVAVASEIEHYCRTKATLNPFPLWHTEVYGDNSICANAVRSLSCSTLGSSICVAHETYTVNGINQYALQIENEKYECEDGHALFTDSYFIVLCPPKEEIVLRSPSVFSGMPALSPSTTIAVDDLDILENIIHSYKNIVAFGELFTLNSVNISYFINLKQNNGINFICQLFGCTECTNPFVVYDSTIILSNGTIYSVARGSFAASAVFTHSLTQSSDYTLVLMLDPQAYHAFVYYAASINFVGSYLQALHLNDESFMKITALSSYTEIRIVPSQDVMINGSSIFHREEIIFLLNIGETVTVSSSKDLTGSRVTASNSVLFHSGHYCASGKTTNCGILNEQIPPYNSWGNTFTLHTNANEVKGNMLKIIASDVGAYLSVNCTTDGANYEASNFNLGFREHMVLSVSHDYCTINSDENILIIQFSDSSPPLMDTFMTIIPAMVHYEDSYVLNAHEGFNNYIAITVKDNDPTKDHLMINNNPVTVAWKMLELDGDTYYFGVVMLTGGRYKVSFLLNSIEFGVMLYGSNKNGAYAFPAGMKLNIIETFTSAVPGAVQNALVTVVGKKINITWSPPFVSNGMILQYIVQKINSSGKSYHYVSGNQNYLELPYLNDALVFIAAVNQYAQSSYELAKSSAPCLPSPCVNNGICVIVNIYDYYCDCGDLLFGQFCQSTQKLYPFGFAHNDILLPSVYASSSLMTLSDEITFYTTKTRFVYVNMNGVISLDAPYTTNYPRSLPLSGYEKIIAPFWTAIDTRGTGQIFYRETTEPRLLARASNDLQEAFHMSQNVTITNLFIATWNGVGYYYKRTDKTNTFQCVLARSQYESFAMFLYADVQWPTYAYGALAGINVGDSFNYATVFGSRTSNIVNIEETSNIGIPGIWIFKIGEDCQPSIHTCVSEFYPFGLTHGDTALESSYGQGRSPLITLSRNFYFYEEALRVVYINDNGVISFDYSFYTRTPVSLPLSGSQKIIAPYWADVDINGTGEIFYRESTDPSLLARASREVQKALSMTKNIEIKSLLIATWNAVGYYYLNTDKVNTFQCILATSERESFVMFLYADLQWTTGSASSGRRGLGGSEALAGFNAGDRLNSYTIDGSQTPRVLKLTRTSNVGMPGTWIFKVGEDCFRQAVKDVVFVIHTGSNIGSTRFQIVRELTQNITINIKSNSPETRFGLITFDEIARFEFDISKHTDLSTLLPAINPGLPYYGGYGTNITSALNLLLSGGMQGGYLQLRGKTSNLAIAITDGYSSSYTQLQSVASSLHATNIFDDVYAVGIGDHSHSDLYAIASNPSFVITTGYLSSSTAPLLLANIVKQLCFAYTPKIFLRSNFSQQGAVGEPYDLVCTIALSSKVQTSSVNLTWDFTSNDNRVTVIPTTITTDDSIGITYTTVIKFAYVTKGDTGDYKCTLMIEKEYLKKSNFYFEIIYPITAIQLFSASVPTVYQPLILQCTATVVRGITSTIDIIWTTGDTQVRRVNNITPSSNINSRSVYNDLFIIPSLDISDIGSIYQCEVFVNSILPSTAKTDFIIPIPGSRCLGHSVLDVVFVIDASGSIGSSDFQLIKEFTANVTTELINNSPSSTVGVIVFATNAHLEFSLQAYTSLSTLLSAISQLSYTGGGTDTAQALTLLLSTAQNGVLGLRSDSSKVAVVITDGHSSNPSATLSAAAALHASNFNVFAIGIGNAYLPELEGIASSPEFVFSTSLFDSTSILELQERISPQLIKCDGDFLNITLLHSANTVGQQQDVICTLSVPPDVNPNSIELGWLYEDDIITDDNRITVNTSNNYYFDSTLVTVIHFNWLAEDDEDEYTCYAIMNGSFIFKPINLQNFEIPVPFVHLTTFNDEMLGNGNLTIGDPLTIVCTVTAVRGISSSVDIWWTIRGRTVKIAQNVTAEVENYFATYIDSIEISSLSAIDNGVKYQCQAVINTRQPIYTSSATITLVFTAPVCFKTSYCEGESVGNDLVSFSHCCFELSGISFASPGLCFQCPKDEICQPDTATCVTEFYNFGLPENDSVLNKTIDSTSRSITLSEIFYFFGQTIRAVYVGDNGIVSLNDSYNSWTPELLPINRTQFIAPYWADFDLRGFGQIYYRQSKDPVLLARATNEIQRAFPLSQNTNVTNLFIVTWDSVGYYNSHVDKTNTLQCVLATTPLESFVIFLYADGRIQWTTGDDNGGIGGLDGIEAVAGINAGDGVNSITIPGSLTPRIINITQTSNVGTPGVWMFKVGEDFNECLINNGECDHICRNLPGSYECSCNTSYILAADNKTCYHVTNDCFYVLVEPSGYINTTGFNSQYASNSSCTWIISLSQYKNIELKFEAMAIEDSPNCVKDSVTIFNGKGEDSLALGSYCGNKLPATIISSTEIVTITFTSDDTVNNQGFRLHYRGLTERSKGVYRCNTVISKTTKFALPTFPSKYNDPFDCVYYFTFPRRTNKMKLTFLYLDILAADCNTDRIEIYDGLSASTASGKICNGNKLLEFMSSNNYVKMTFIGKSVGKYRGFHAKVTFS